MTDNQLVGVCSFGVPASPSLVCGSFHGEYKDIFYELNRLCVTDGLPRNALSFFVSRCLKMLPKPMVIVSYADSGHNHHGYIYQATNWIYTGRSAERRDAILCGQEQKHSRHQCDDIRKGQEKRGDGVKRMIENGEAVMVNRSSKFRYFYFLGDKRETKKMKSLLSYKEEPYPKGDNIRYDASYQPTIQQILF